jgi:hypothetical protein
LYFDHWAKPVYVLLASPFAQLGFVGLKIFNALITLITIITTCKVAEELNFKNAKLILIIMLFSPLYYILTFSGLTEPLFALFVSLGIYFSTKNKFNLAFIIISFLPYVRSEGLIIIGVFILFAIYNRLWKLIPLFLCGSLFYAIAGYFVHHDFLWVFTKIPYAKLSSVYGHGPLFHFVEKLINVTGVPIYILFWIGFLSLVYSTFNSKQNAVAYILILIGFITFFIAHSLFWYLGIFNSMGLQRVLLCLMPMIAVIALQGFNFLTENEYLLNHNIKLSIQFVLILLMLVFPFVPNPAAINWKKDMLLSQEQTTAKEIVACIKRKRSLQYPILYNHHYLSDVFNLDHFDNTMHEKITDFSISKMKVGDLVVWDDKFSREESDISLQALISKTELKIICCTNTYQQSFTVFEKK